MILQSTKMSWKSICSNKMRSFLTMLGIMIGVFALVVLVSFVNGATSSVTDSISGLGTNLISVKISDNKGKPVKMTDLDSWKKEDTIGDIAPLAQSPMTVSSSLSEETAVVYGTTGSYFDIAGLEISTGREIKSVDVDNHTPVAVINDSVANDIMGRTNVVGETIKIGGIHFTIIGVLPEKESDLSSRMGNSYQVYIPFTTLIRCADGVSSDVTTFYVSAKSDDVLSDVEAKIEEIMLNRFSQDSDAFQIYNQSSIAEVMSSVTSVLSLLLGGIAAISLLVGGVGIMNIMLVSVAERTREIGIRKAIGASRQVIMLQFLIESFIISMMGCMIGIVLSFVTMKIICLIGNVDYGLSMKAIFLSIGFSMMIGLVFGSYPANKAAKMKPIDALRYIG